MPYPGMVQLTYWTDTPFDTLWATGFTHSSSRRDDPQGDLVMTFIDETRGETSRLSVVVPASVVDSQFAWDHIWARLPKTYPKRRWWLR